MFVETVGAWIGALVVLSAGVGLFSQRKGLGFAYGFWFSLFLSPIIGAIIVAGTSPTQSETDRQLLASGDSRKCPSCAEVVKAEATKCRYCGERLQPLVSKALLSEDARRFRVQGTRPDGKEVTKTLEADNANNAAEKAR